MMCVLCSCLVLAFPFQDEANNLENLHLPLKVVRFQPIHIQIQTFMDAEQILIRFLKTFVSLH